MSANQEIVPAERYGHASPRVRGAAVVYRLCDVGDEIRLDRADALLTEGTGRSSARRTTLREISSRGTQEFRVPEQPTRRGDAAPVAGHTRTSADAIQIKNPPLAVDLGTDRLSIDGRTREIRVSARLFDFGVISLRLHIHAPHELSWTDYVSFATAAATAPDIGPLVERQLDLLLERVREAIVGFELAPIVEDYVVYRVESLTDGSGGPVPRSVMRSLDVAPLLLEDSREIAEEALAELLPHRFSYYADDLAVVSWNSALVVDPVPDDTEVQFILEFANAQLLELRCFDERLDRELPTMHDRVASARAGVRALLHRRFAGVLGELQTLVAESMAIVERVDNSLKVTDDVYLARVYSAALSLFRERAWRNGIDRKLAIMRETYAMLNAESQAARAEVLELAIIVLIVGELLAAALLR